MSNTRAVVNIDLLAGLKGDLGEEILLDLIGAFLGDIDNHRQALLEAATEKNTEKLEVAAHTLKGMAGNLGVDQVFAASQEVVTAVRTGKADEAFILTATLLDLVDTAIATLKDMDFSAL